MSVVIAFAVGVIASAVGEAFLPANVQAFIARARAYIAGKLGRSPE